jgi:hypothetical protein
MRLVGPGALAGACVSLTLLVFAPVAVPAVRSPLDRADMQRAVNLARWPRTDADRARFHARYVFAPNGPVVDAWTVEQVEIVTEFRRLELMAEEHARLNDTWARAGLREAEEAMRPWRGVLTVRARLGLRATRLYVGGVPPLWMEIDGADVTAWGEPSRAALYANCGGDTIGCPMVGALIEHSFQAQSIGQVSRRVRVRSPGPDLASVLVDFGSIE